MVEILKQIKGVDKRVYDILLTCPEVRNNLTGLIAKYWEEYTRFDYKSSGSFHIDMYTPKLIPILTIDRACRKVRKIDENLWKPYSKKYEDAVIDLKDNNPSQGDLYE